jgi:hypothetical protein
MAIEKNVGLKDRNIRMIAGVVFIMLALFQIFGTWSLVLGILLLLSGLTRFCFLYQLLGKNTCESP